MTLELSEILRSKQEYRQRLAALPMAEKLRLLDQLRESSLDITASRARQGGRGWTNGKPRWWGVG